MLNINQNCRRKKKRKKPTQNKTKSHTLTRKNKTQLLLFYEFEDAFFKVGSILRQVLYMVCGYRLWLPVSLSQVP